MGKSFVKLIEQSIQKFDCPAFSNYKSDTLKNRKIAQRIDKTHAFFPPLSHYQPSTKN